MHNGTPTWYHFSQYVDMNIGWYKDIDGSWYFIGTVDDSELGAMRTGWIVDTDDGNTYYLDPTTGKMVTGQVTIDGKTYYFNEAHPESGWVQNAEGYWVHNKNGSLPYGALKR